NDLGAEVNGDGTDNSRAELVAAEIRDGGGTAIANTDSVATEEGARRIARDALNAYGRVDILINNAGISIFRPFLETAETEFRRHLDVHLVGAFNVTKAVWPAMGDQGYGRVVMTVSSAVF